MPVNPRKEAKEALNTALRVANETYDVAVARTIKAHNKKVERAWQIYREALKKIQEGNDGSQK